MGIVVQKFGGSSVADLEKLEQVSNHIIYEYNKGNKVVVVVSAQGKTTNKLISEAEEISSDTNLRELDSLISVGEQITASKLSMLLNKLGYKAISLTGWQIPIITTNEHGNAKIKNINSDKILSLLDENYIVIVAGFQGIDETGEITTLGRGGSDTTAVALASVLDSEKCEIYTDVDGVYSSDPRIVKDVRKINEISYDEMLELSSMGAKVLHNRCVEIGKKYNTPIIVKSTFEEQSQGTRVDSSSIESHIISGIAKDDNIARITLIGLENVLGKTYQVFKLLSDNNINVDIIVQSFGETVSKDVSFTVKNSDLDKTMKILKENCEIVNAKEILSNKDFSKISIIGVGITNTPGVASKMFGALYDNKINMHIISTSEIKISVLVNSDEADLALNAIHKAFFGDK
ncbi:MAG: aspartate kinase [Clostridia bacterium]|nr:aspartate kinase [Clostridia bacterium]